MMWCVFGWLFSALGVLATCAPTACQRQSRPESVLLQTKAMRLDAHDVTSRSQSSDLVAVYEFLGEAHKQRAFATPPAWNHGGVAKVRGRVRFCVWKAQKPGGGFVYDWWDDVKKGHTFHTGAAWDAFWDHFNDHHTFRHEHKWSYGFVAEWKGSRVSYVRSESCNDVAKHTRAEHAAGLKPVFAFWDERHKQHTFHLMPPWVHGHTFEQQGDMQFFAYDGPVEGSEAVYGFWDTVNAQHTFHFPPAWQNEITMDVQFYAFRTDSVAGLVPIHVFWDLANKQHTFHALPAWPNEKQGDVEFYAFVVLDRTVVTTVPSPEPTSVPTVDSTNEPTLEPTQVPTVELTSSMPTFGPTSMPAALPTISPTVRPSTTFQPTLAPTVEPTTMATYVPTSMPTDLPHSCHTCVEGDRCFRDVRWAMKHGVYLHPEWYPGLGHAACFEEVQSFLHRRQHKDELHWRGMVHFPSPQPMPFPCDVDVPSHIRYGLLYCR